MNVDAYMPDRLFVAGLTPSTTVCHHISDKLNAAMDILQDAGMLDEQRARTLVLCEQTRAGEPFDNDPEKLARKLVRLGTALRGT